MPTNTSAASSSRRRRRRKSLPPWILLNNEGYIGSRPNATTAVGEGSDNLTFEASIWPAQPPLPSNLFVYCPSLKFPSPTLILSTSQDLLLFRVPVAVGPASSSVAFNDCDYFVCRSGGVTRPPSLTLIPDPNPNIFHVALGVLARGGDLYTVAALHARPPSNDKVYNFDEIFPKLLKYRLFR